MLKERARIISFVMLLGDAACVSIALLAAIFFRDLLLRLDPSVFANFSVGSFLAVLAISVVAFGATFHVNGLYDSFRLRSMREEMRLVAKAVSAATCILVVGLVLFDLRFVSRVVLVSFFVASGVLIVAERIAARSLLRVMRRRHLNYRNVLIVGTNAKAMELGSSFRRNRHWGVRVLGYVGEHRPELGPLLLGDIGSLPDLLERHVVDAVFQLDPYSNVELTKRLVEHCRTIGIPTYFPPLFEDGPRLHLHEIAGVKMLNVQTTLANDYHLFLKRVFDIVASSLLLFIFSPALILIPILIWLDSGGPIVFSQMRVGLNGRLFRLFKFRTMVVEAERMRADLLAHNEADGPVFKMREDPRITRVGRVLRRFSLDELPQLFNVISGQMSLVGPRPPIPEEVRCYERWQRRRLSVKPGLTCLWQVSGRNEVDFERWMQLDMEYIDQWSWWLDLRILIRTIPAMMKGL